MIQKITLIIVLFIFSSFAWAGPCCSKPSNPYVCKQLRLPSFQSIRADGDIDLQIEGSSYRQSVTVSGRLESVQGIRMLVREQTLYVANIKQPQASCRAKIRLAMPQLKQLSYGCGFGNIYIKQPWTNSPISLSIYGNPKVSIHGNIRLGKLIVGGNAVLSVYWINSCDVYLRAMDNARICLAGTAGILEADTFQSARVNARYLRAKRAFIKAYGQSRVDIRAICSLNALALQNSEIYYYQDPKFQIPYMQCAGSVINMTQPCRPPCSICDNACSKNDWH